MSPGGLGDPRPYWHSKYVGLAVEMGPLLAWVALGAPGGGPGGHTEVALPAQGKVATAGL